jgi:hypothetical protein
MTHRLPLPFGICIECQHAGAVLTHETGRVAMYCPHNRAGGFMQPTKDEGPIWTIHTPISRDEFAEALTRFLERYDQALKRQPSGIDLGSSETEQG